MKTLKKVDSWLLGWCQGIADWTSYAAVDEEGYIKISFLMLLLLTPAISGFIYLEYSLIGIPLILMVVLGVYWGFYSFLVQEEQEVRSSSRNSFRALRNPARYVYYRYSSWLVALVALCMIVFPFEESNRSGTSNVLMLSIVFALIAFWYFLSCSPTEMSFQAQLTYQRVNRKNTRR